MKPKQAQTAKRPHSADRPFPWRCRHCGQDKVALTTLRYDAEVRHHGRLHAFTVPNLALPVCQECGEKVFTEMVDDQIHAALRVHLDSLTPAGTGKNPMSQVKKQI